MEREHFDKGVRAILLGLASVAETIIWASHEDRGRIEEAWCALEQIGELADEFAPPVEGEQAQEAPRD